MALRVAGSAAGSFADNIDVLEVMSNDWYVVGTNEVIPHEQIGQITKKLISGQGSSLMSLKGLGFRNTKNTQTNLINNQKLEKRA